MAVPVSVIIVTIQFPEGWFLERPSRSLPFGVSQHNLSGLRLRIRRFPRCVFCRLDLVALYTFILFTLYSFFFSLVSAERDKFFSGNRVAQNTTHLNILI